MRNFIQPIRSTTQICLVTRHQYGISTLVSFGGETSGSVLGHEVFSPERSLNQPNATRVCVRSINQSNRSFSVCCFCFVRAFQFKFIRKSLQCNEDTSLWTLVKVVDMLSYTACLQISLGKNKSKKLKI